MNMNTVYYDTKPPIYEPVGDGSYRYRWDIQEVEVIVAGAEENAEARTQWECKEVVVWATVTREKITAAVIAALWPSDYEAKLMNDYNAAKEGVLEDAQKYIDRYTAFLAERKAIKEQVATDCETLNIR
jgi:hypothetical protein